MRKLFRSLTNATHSKWITIPAIAYLLLLLVLALFADWLPLAFSPGEAMAHTPLLEPFNWEMYEVGKPFHWLGTDYMGRDLLAILVYGARTALRISVPTMALATLVGVGLGIVAGYYGDTGIKWSLGKGLALLIASFFFVFFAFVARFSFLPGNNPDGNSVLKIILVAVTSYLLNKALWFLFLKLPFFGRRIPLPVDFFLLKIIEIFGAVPRLLLVLCLAAFFPPSVQNIIWLGMFTFWPGIARLARAETLKQKGLPYMEAAVSLGFSPVRILTRHALPNMLVPIMVAVTFGICNLIALESTLTFLGYGLPPETPSWGQAIRGFRAYTDAWWLLLFPGLCIILLVLALQNVNNYLIQRLQPNKAR
ncbi:hypothetical protein AAE02nite_47320 [Adhaeribacter aerolatus]|uniref:ABC transmembrane type-1 domain-containing protein n=1 Tax=Adhaeribacter aerolatus TaxID=670289 RepID=A0A512B524_9BACT|nr:ABC transporter permease [Adhaeribacter aerolatus]GEO07068.1 hypothetical protein AAE02nite_47320 [Adhaeribacter aerolatus]